ncbi:polyisoprenoid diphosphate/phosphate phosphohydrolase PLPP6 [Salminus brasiliensis]|uniref:polyisoprenoid diphosphate/phosphate phosphohydrolase PLPP6 n=1 Tax=Salminus brasiliensis TaxID=930266 RepID=UPI003B83706A
MPSPKARSSGGVGGGGGGGGGSSSGSGGGGGGGVGRYEFMSLSRSPPPPSLQRQGSDPTAARLRAADSPTRRRGSGSSTSSTGGQQLPEEDCMRLNPSIIGIALSSLLAIDLWLSKRLGVCACEDSSWGSMRPLMKLVEVSGHGIPWLVGAAYCLYKSDSAAGQEVMLNLLMALVLDLVLVAIVKAVVRRRRPAHNRMDMFVTFSVDRYSFPSGHATRAAMCARFLLAHLVLAAPLRVLVLLWAVFVGFSRVLLGRHNVTDVAFGFFMGYCQYNLVEALWLSPVTLQNMMGQLE